MTYLENIKLVAELITSIATAFILLKHLTIIYNPINKFLKITVPAFFIGCLAPDGKKIRFFKGLKRQREQDIEINKVIAKDFEMEEVFVLNKEKLIEIISNSDAFYKIYQRKK
jgi:N-acetylglutamate synthase-like GNAT family acetyltransferase